MEYEKKYNDLIARINAVKNTPKIGMKSKHHYDGYVETGIRDALDYILNPESEDERIRKEILGFIEQVLKDKNVLLLVADRIGDDIPNMIPGWIAYLEKQKEPRKYRKLYEEVVKSDWFKENYVGKSLGEGHQPAEWNEEDEQMLQAIIKRYEFAVESDCSVFIKKERLTQMEKELDWLKSLRGHSEIYRRWLGNNKQEPFFFEEYPL